MLIECEVCLVVWDYSLGLVVLVEKLCQCLQLENIILILGVEGILVYVQFEGELDWFIDCLLVFNSLFKDMVGVGDSFFICIFMVMMVGVDIW